MKLAIVASHPIQYQAPIFRELAGRDGLDLRVFFGRMPDAKAQGEGFGVEFQWDVPLIEGYRHEVFANGLESVGDVAGMFAAWRHLRRAWSMDRPDVVLHTGWHHACMFPALAAARSLRLPCLLRCEANLHAPRGMCQRAWHRWVLRRYAAFLPIGKANAEYYDVFGPGGTPRFSAPYFSGHQFVGPRAAAIGTDRASARARFGLGIDEFCFLFAGKFVPKKRPADLLRAALKMGEASRIRILLVGAGREESELRRIAAAAPGMAVFTGFLNQSEMPMAYTAADCLVLPSDSGETWGLVVNEAMASGLPAIVSDEVGCVADLVEEGETGMVFRCGDVEGLADRLCRMAADPGQAARMGARARERVAGYSAERAAEGIRLAAETVAREVAR